MSACVASATPYDASSAPLIVTGSMMTPVSSTPTIITGAGASWSLDVAYQDWGSEGYAYVTLEVAPNTRVQLTNGSLQNTITAGVEGWYWGDVVLFASAVNPNSAIAGKVAGPYGSNPPLGVMAWVNDATYNDNGFGTMTKEQLNTLGYRYNGGYGGSFNTYLDAILGYSANVENFKDGGLDIVGGAYVGWNEGSATSMLNGTPARKLTDILYPAGGLNRPLKDQTYAFDGSVLTGSTRTYVTLIVRGGGSGEGFILVDNLTLSFSSPDYLPITGAMMNTVLSTGSSVAVNGAGSDWSLDVAGSGEAEGYAYTTFVVAPNTRVQLTSGSVQNTFSGDWYFGDVVLFASSVNPSAPIAGKVQGPTTPQTNADPAPGVMAWLSYSQFKANGYKLLYRSKETVNSAGYRYMDNDGSSASYLAAIGQYSSNVENFRDGGLDMLGGAYVGWNQLSAPLMTNGTPACALTDILYPAWGGLNRPLKDQTFAFDGTVCTGSGNMFVTVMVRGGGGCASGSVIVKNLGVSLSPANTLKVTGPMMTAVKSSGTSASVSGAGSEWSLDLVGSGEAEGYAYTTFVVGPNTKVQITEGSVSNTVGGASWRYGDLVFFASAANPSAAIAGKVQGPVVPAANPAPGVMAYITGPQYKAAGYRATYQAKALVNNAGYRYYENDGSCGSYLAAISQYSSNVENFQDGDLDINGGAYVGWSAAANTFMFDSPAANHPLTDVLYPAWGGLNRALRDQTYAFDGTVYTGSSNMFVTVMLRGGGDGNGGTIALRDLTLTFTSPGYLPPLDVVGQGNSVLLSWPGNAPGLVVEQSETLDSGSAVWTPVTEQPTLQDGNWTLQQAVAPGSRFYRLRMK